MGGGSVAHRGAEANAFVGPLWHGDCIAGVMSDETYTTLLLWAICTLIFACGVVALTEHPEWFGT